MGVSSNLSTLMGQRRYSIQDVHERTGLSRNTVSILYNDKATRIDYATIEKLCGLFGCGIDQLLTLPSERLIQKVAEEEVTYEQKP